MSAISDYSCVSILWKNFAALSKGTINFLGLCSNQRVGVFFPKKLDRPYSHDVISRVTSGWTPSGYAGWRLFILVRNFIIVWPSLSHGVGARVIWWSVARNSWNAGRSLKRKKKKKWIERKSFQSNLKDLDVKIEGKKMLSPTKGEEIKSWLKKSPENAQRLWGGFDNYSVKKSLGHPVSGIG